MLTTFTPTSLMSDCFHFTDSKQHFWIRCRIVLHNAVFFILLVYVSRALFPIILLFKHMHAHILYTTHSILPLFRLHTYHKWSSSFLSLLPIVVFIRWHEVYFYFRMRTCSDMIGAMSHNSIALFIGSRNYYSLLSHHNFSLGYLTSKFFQFIFWDPDRI